MIKKYTLILLLTFSNCCLYSQISKKEIIQLEIKLFNDLANVKCQGTSAIHSYINGTKIFIMDKKYDNGLLFYKLNQKFSSSLSVGVYDEYSGYRIVSENSYVYYYITEKGKFIETHKEDDTFFLVYEYKE